MLTCLCLSFTHKPNLLAPTPLLLRARDLLHSRCVPREPQHRRPLTRRESRRRAQTVRRNAHKRRRHVELHALRLLAKRPSPTLQSTLPLHATPQRRFLELHHRRLRPKRRPPRRVPLLRRRVVQRRDPNVVSYTAMVDGYARVEGGIGRARALFEAMPRRNAVSLVVMINGLVENGLCEESWDVFVRMPQKNDVARTAMITGFCKEGKMEDARTLFQEIALRPKWERGRGTEFVSQMIRTGMQPDDLTFVSVFIVCASLTSLEEGSKAHALVIKHGFDSDLSVCNALITMHSKCGGIVDF
ncbi:Pentatricopeptide repeat-containing protein, mitochondrial [Glycine max]|nr:Pentatricopeptide repeat-containing protein, mitochondrial [Glycine max]